MSKELIKTTSRGTELPLLNLKGKPYLQVAHRLVWFREEHPTGRIVTSLLSLDTKSAVAKAEIYIVGQMPNGDPFNMLLASAHKKETEANFGDFIEKAETGAIGRALAMAGYGTQFEPELDEGDRLADAPINVAKKGTPANEERKQETPKASSVKAAPAPNGAGIKSKGSVPAGTPLRDKSPREKANDLILMHKNILLSKKIFKSEDDYFSLLSSEFKVGSGADLTDEQANKLLEILKGKLNS